MQEGIWVQTEEEFLLNNIYPYHVPFYVLSMLQLGEGNSGHRGRGSLNKDDEGCEGEERWGPPELHD